MGVSLDFYFLCYVVVPINLTATPCNSSSFKVKKEALGSVLASLGNADEAGQRIGLTALAMVSSQPHRPSLRGLPLLLALASF